MILQIDSIGIPVEDVLKISPYNGAAFGVVVLLLLIAVYYFKNLSEKKQEYIDRIIDKTHELQQQTSDKLNDISHVNNSTSEAIKVFLQEIDRKLNELSRLK